MHTLIHAFIASHINYCKTILYGVSHALIHWLPAVLHATSQLVTGVWRNDRIMPALHDTFHWQPVSWCITFKIVLMTLEYICGQSPAYFTWCPYQSPSLLPLLASLCWLRGHDHFTHSYCMLWSMQFLCGCTTDLEHLAFSSQGQKHWLKTVYIKP